MVKDWKKQLSVEEMIIPCGLETAYGAGILVISSWGNGLMPDDTLL